MMNNVFLPTISDILASEGLDTFIDSHQTRGANSINPRDPSDKRQKRLKAEREWFSGVGSVNQLLKTLVIHKSRESSDIVHSHKYRCSNSVSRLEKDHLTPEQLPPPIVSLPTQVGSHPQGLVISGMSPILTHSALALNFATQIFIPQPPDTWESFSSHLRQKLPLLPTKSGDCASVPPTLAFPLLPQDPLAKEPFCVVLTSQFSLVMVLGTDIQGYPAFQFSFDPDRVKQVLELLRERMSEVSSYAGVDLPEHLNSQLDVLAELTQQFYPVTPHYQTVTQFSRLLLQNLPAQVEKKAEFLKACHATSAQTVKSPELKTDKSTPDKDQAKATSTDTAQQTPRLNQTLYSFQVELLQAIAHEVRTPLATIHTLTRLLLKRRNLDPEVVRKRLEMIDHECTTQIDRFNLIFRAVELELSKAKKASQGSAAKPTVQLTPMSLGDIFQNSLPRWQKQARQRNHTLEVNIPQNLPTVVSDPTMLDQVLTGVIENFTRSLPAGSHIMVDVRLAGHLLKLQLESQSDAQKSSPFGATPKSPLKSLGPLLMFQPETGVLSLNMTVTKNLFQALGGKLVVRQRPEQGKVMTIFLPLKS